MNNLSNIIQAALTILLAIIIGWGIINGITGRDVNHIEIVERQDALDDQLRYISCLLLIEPQDRDPSAVAECQVES